MGELSRSHSSPARGVRLVWLLLALCLAWAVACSDESAPGPLGNGIYIGTEWQEARAQAGHQVHVVEQHIACAKCHTMGKSSMGSFTPDRCASCHEKEGSLVHAEAEAHARFGATAKADCTACHVFRLHDPELEQPALPTSGASELPPADLTQAGAYQPKDCFRCHGEQQGDTPAVVVHSSAPCLTCHRPHGDQKVNVNPCSECHQELTQAPIGHGLGKEGVVQTCTTCHQHQHARASEALDTCADCHQKQEPLIPATALFENGHRACVGCHQPHAFEKQNAVACRSCHEDMNLLGGKRIKAHQECTACHQPHAVRESPAKACAKCHQDVHPNHPVRKDAGQCVNCHDPHPANARTKAFARSCSDCHQKAASDQAFHEQVECKSCHQPHRFVLAGADQKALCNRCHSQQVTLAAVIESGGQKSATGAGHQNCQGCHRGLPHQPKALRATCASCHESQGAAVRKGHQECLGCHEPHSGKQREGDIPATCGSCHRQERNTAPAGHLACASCHEPHTGNHPKACASCHAEPAKTPHGKISADCASCHRPHGPAGVTSPPTCTSCHDPKKLPGLHRLKQHETCSGCHTGHGEMLASTGKVVQALDRGACTSCHQKREEHFPDSSTCTSCHLFTPTR